VVAYTWLWIILGKKVISVFQGNLNAKPAGLKCCPGRTFFTGESRRGKLVRGFNGIEIVNLWP
jgi:hypothetical protein